MQYINEKPIVHDETGEVLQTSINPEVFDTGKHKVYAKQGRQLKVLHRALTRGKPKVKLSDAERIMRHRIGRNQSGLRSPRDREGQRKNVLQVHDSYNPLLKEDDNDTPLNPRTPLDPVMQALRKKRKERLQRATHGNAPPIFPDPMDAEMNEDSPSLIKQPRFGHRTRQTIRTVKRKKGLTGSDTYRPTTSHATLVKNQPWRMKEKLKGLLAMWSKSGGGTRQVVKNIPVTPKFGTKRIKKIHAPKSETDLK
jgi:hypothetical protein